MGSAPLTRVVGITGKYCSGKNRVGEILGRNGYSIIDVDVLGHSALEREKERVVRRFGETILGPDGRIDRKRLGSIVFADGRKRKELEEILHPGMIADVARIVEGDLEPSKTGFAINAALLFEMGLQQFCRKVLWIHAPLLQRMRRAKRRDRLTYVQVFERFWAQRKLSPQPWMKAVDIHTISNSVGEEELASVILRVLK